MNRLEEAKKEMRKLDLPAIDNALRVVAEYDHEKNRALISKINKLARDTKTDNVYEPLINVGTYRKQLVERALSTINGIMVEFTYEEAKL